VIAGFGEAAGLASSSGCDGVEVNAGQHSLVRQFLSGLTNHRGDDWGADKLRFASEVLAAVRAAAGDAAVVGLRLSCDELAPWAGITPDAAAEIAVALCESIDYLTVVRGSIYSVSATRPDTHVEPGFNRDLCRQIRSALPAGVAVVMQGSMVDVDMAEAAIADGTADAIEMTRAQIADPDLAAKVAAGDANRVRPCILCNQTCQVRDNRNPLVSCVVEPSAGHESEDQPVPLSRELGGASLHLLVVGAGTAGLECARVAALAGFRVTVVERRRSTGGMIRIAAGASGRYRLSLIAAWLLQECEQLGVGIELGVDAGIDRIEAHNEPVVICTGARPGERAYPVRPGATVLNPEEVLSNAAIVPEGPVAVWDPIGGPVAVSVAETLRASGRDVTLISPDVVVGTQLSRSGDLAPANVRLQSSDVELVRRARIDEVTSGEVRVSDIFSAETRALDASALVDCGARLPEDRLWRTSGEHLPRAGDAVAPRTVYEAILEGRRAAQQLARMAPAAR
ncbi:MAG: NAD(P)-binding protein, partial [Acidimicrobiales bacterium]